MGKHQGERGSRKDKEKARSRDLMVVSRRRNGQGGEGKLEQT